MHEVFLFLDLIDNAHLPSIMRQTTSSFQATKRPKMAPINFYPFVYCLILALLAGCQNTPTGYRPPVKRLDLRAHHLADLPAHLPPDYPLETLYLRDNHFEEMPPVWRLQHLKVLDISGNPLKRLPEAMRSMPALVALDIEDTDIYTLPTWLFALPKLENLVIYHNWKLQGFRLSEHGSSSLKQLSISGNMWLRQVPDDAFDMPQLRYLNISFHPFLPRLPRSIGKLAKLDTLILEANALDKVPAELADLQQLTYLDLSSNHGPFDDLSPITSLHGLRDLYLVGCGIQRIPDALYDLVHLQHLWLSQNQVGSLSDKIGQLTALKKLGLSEMGLKQLPATIVQLRNLRVLHLRDNPGLQFPARMSDLSQLEALDLDNCGLQEVPAWLVQLPRLQRLYLRGNPIRNGLDQLVQIDSLSTLDLVDCQLTTVPDFLRKLTHLDELNLSKNPIREFPLAILDHLTIDQLTLDETQLDKEAMRQLADHPHVKHLYPDRY
jgi:Leucine-rich repeat (LRR) protein